MAKKDQCCDAIDSVYTMESVLSVDTKGQILLPKDVRERMGIEPGQKLALVSSTEEGRICCLHLFKNDELAGLLKGAMDKMVK